MTPVSIPGDAFEQDLPHPDDRPAPEIEQPSPAELLIGLLDGTVSRLARRPVKIRTKVSPAGLLRGRVDVVVFELSGLKTTGLLVDRVVVHAEQVRVEPGLPPHFKAGPVGFKATVTQAAVDRWTKASKLPVRLQLTEDGILATTKVRGFQLAQVATELSVAGPLLQLRPRRASMLGLPTPLVGFLRGYLPLPPLPMGARLRRVESEEGELTTWFTVDDVDEPLSPLMANRLTRLLPGLPRFPR